MFIRLNFDVPFSELLNSKIIEIVISSKTTTVQDVMAVFLERYPEAKKKFEEKKLLKDGNLRAIYVVDKKVVRLDTSLNGDCDIRVLNPICGG